MRKKVMPDGLSPLLTVMELNVAQVFWVGRALALLKTAALGSVAPAALVEVEAKTARPAGPFGVLFCASKLRVTLARPVVSIANWK
jgi:hypothetical protein